MEPASCVPSRPVHQQNSVRTRRNAAGYFFEVQLHGTGVGIRQRERCAGSARRANSAEQIRILVALIGGLTGPRAAPGPLPDNTILLADAGLILKPDFDRFFLGNISKLRVQLASKVFLNASMISASWPG